MTTRRSAKRPAKGRATRPRPPARKASQRPSAAVLARTRAERQRRERQARRALAPQAVVVGMILAALAISAMYPARQLVAKRARIATLQRDSAQLDQEIARLRAQRDALQTDAEIERIAREQLAMIRPGETAFAVVPAKSPPPAPPAKVAAAAPAPPSGPGAVARWWRAFLRSARLFR